MHTSSEGSLIADGSYIVVLVKYPDRCYIEPYLSHKYIIRDGLYHPTPSEFVPISEETPSILPRSSFLTIQTPCLVAMLLCQYRTPYS